MNNSSRPVVLIVEDELLIRMDAIEMIEAAGFDTLEAGNADEAIAILSTRPDIHVVFTDIQMPGSMDGVKLAHSFATVGRPSKSSPHRPIFGLKGTSFRTAAASCQNPIRPGKWRRI